MSRTAAISGPVQVAASRLTVPVQVTDLTATDSIVVFTSTFKVTVTPFCNAPPAGTWMVRVASRVFHIPVYIEPSASPLLPSPRPGLVKGLLNACSPPQSSILSFQP